MLEFILGLIFCTVFITAFSGAMLIVIDKQNEWDARHKK
jgi:hypothetical protein